ncbi:hypothetical protein GGS20DRAFT_104570 [Poronia punctata]|nr:hypothetical protein GGS20DRAFT_104570 [Poronia punctata]
MHRTGAIARQRSVCHMCESISAQRRPVATPLSTIKDVSQSSYQSRRAMSFTKATPTCRLSPTRTSPAKLHYAISNIRPMATNPPNPPPSFLLGLLGYRKNGVLSSPAPSEESVGEALEFCETLASALTDENVQFAHSHWEQAIKELDSTASALLSLDGENERKMTRWTRSEDAETTVSPPEFMDKVSNTAYLVLAHPPVSITPKLLKQYVKIQAKLKRPETLPKVFQLYASKPVLVKDSVPPSYTRPNPDRAANAIESETIELALDTAIGAKNLDAAVGIIENSYGTTAFVRGKLLRHGLLPATAFAATPVAAYALAVNFSGIQQAMDTAMATNVAFAGILAYVGFTASIGIVALTTANDQMKRVTWAPGQPLRKRWIREEERAALDKIACAWGFQEPWRQGEEEGGDWEALREYILQKGMMLDRTELLEGMD